MTTPETTSEKTPAGKFGPPVTLTPQPPNKSTPFESPVNNLVRTGTSGHGDDSLWFAVCEAYNRKVYKLPTEQKIEFIKNLRRALLEGNKAARILNIFAYLRSGGKTDILDCFIKTYLSHNWATAIILPQLITDDEAVQCKDSQGLVDIAKKHEVWALVRDEDRMEHVIRVCKNLGKMIFYEGELDDRVVLQRMARYIERNLFVIDPSFNLTGYYLSPSEYADYHVILAIPMGDGINQHEVIGERSVEKNEDGRYTIKREFTKHDAIIQLLTSLT